jgi:[NiFe] hydrogenase diaphorase moiety large subunit
MISKATEKALERYDFDRSRLLDILLFIKEEEGFINEAAAARLTEALNLSFADLEQTVSFYHFLHFEPRGEMTIYLNNSIIAEHQGRAEVARAFEEELGIGFGEVTEDGAIGLFETPCIGMSDQEPAALIGQRVFTRLTPYRVRLIVRDLRRGEDPFSPFKVPEGGGMNADPRIHSMVCNNIQYPGHLLGPSYIPGRMIEHKLTKMSPMEILDRVQASNLRGRGGAGFPTGLKWRFCREAEGLKKYIFCNADEGEPGTFKDRVLLTERPEMVFEGMLTAAYAIGAQEGVVYLRYEYSYLRAYLESVLQEMRDRGCLGKKACGIEGLNFDIRIQMGAGSYVCGEESALIESAEGKRGEPRNRPPFPVESGYLGYPTVVNNVETFCSVVNIMEYGAEWYAEQGVNDSAGTKLLSISGDCQFPGIYELEWGLSLHDLLEITGATDTQAIQVGGPSGKLVGPESFRRTLTYADLATGGSIMIFDKSRDIIDIVLNYLNFFIAESCGSCVPCRNIPTLLRQKLLKIKSGRGTKQDVKDLRSWSELTAVNRCGLGHTATNPVKSLLADFGYLLTERINVRSRFESTVDLLEAVRASCEFVNREPQIHEQL